MNMELRLDMMISFSVLNLNIIFLLNSDFMKNTLILKRKLDNDIVQNIKQILHC